MVIRLVVGFYSASWVSLK